MSWSTHSIVAKREKETADNPRKIGGFGVPGAIRTPGLPLRRRPLYPTELRGLIQKLFNYEGLQDSNDSIFRRLVKH